MDFEKFMSERKPVRFRIIEQITPLLAAFLREYHLYPILTIRSRPQPGCLQKRCFVNVDKQVAKIGGKMITGWIFNEYENTVISSEAHAVWERPNGEKTDITPHRFPPKKILFVPDPKVELKRGYTAGPNLTLSDDPHEIALSNFCSEAGRLREERFEGFGQYIEVTNGDIENMRLKYGIPFDIAKELLCDIISMA
jgi:hypothetical protein